ncbi:MAG TPA: hypothetical protein VGH28_14185 [Polyangiaceae bacterium]|jgi:hypothetical protein
MDRPLASLVSACFCGVFVIVGCGDASAPRIDGPGAHDQGSSSVGSGGTADAGPDGPGYRDPATEDGGCSVPNLVCGGVCIAVGSDPANCGACGNACIGDDSTCVGGQCACGSPGMDYCDGAGCMDITSDFNNCGFCGNACDPNNDQACSNGVCVPND